MKASDGGVSGRFRYFAHAKLGSLCADHGAVAKQVGGRPNNRAHAASLSAPGHPILSTRASRGDGPMSERAFAAFFCRCIQERNEPLVRPNCSAGLANCDAALEVLLTGFAESRQSLTAMCHKHRMGLEPELVADAAIVPVADVEVRAEAFGTPALVVEPAELGEVDGRWTWSEETRLSVT